jgi:hypothetical protein
MEKFTGYIKRIGISISVLFNVLLGGESNQTFSARNYGWKKEGKLNLVWLINFIARYVFNDSDHCLNSWVYWHTRKNKGVSI